MFTKVAPKPTNHSRFTGKCGRPRCRGCHQHPASKSINKTKATHKLRSANLVSNCRLATWRVVDAKPGLNFPGFSVSRVLDHLDNNDYWDEDDDDDCEDEAYAEDSYQDRENEGDEESEVTTSFCDVGLVWDRADEDEVSPLRIDVNVMHSIWNIMSMDGCEADITSHPNEEEMVHISLLSSGLGIDVELECQSVKVSAADLNAIDIDGEQVCQSSKGSSVDKNGMNMDGEQQWQSPDFSSVDKYVIDADDKHKGHNLKVDLYVANSKSRYNINNLEDDPTPFCIGGLFLIHRRAFPVCFICSAPKADLSREGDSFPLSATVGTLSLRAGTSTYAAALFLIHRRAFPVCFICSAFSELS
ncbi:hypothetical protein TEA_002935 [Camellia sinensis var. sinensis]|uniref:Uncharacterized protein n=1 Tax=Camellia sinensis var. sinensis TaxID=542762 RepID=A0A4S4CXV2_CAMSN|nr:hypothetical protein TEA_002935 [Camellia sinensis var. sinensis]